MPEKAGPPELVASVDSPEAGYAALQYGADAVCAGVKGFSDRSPSLKLRSAGPDAALAKAGRADAGGLTLAELDGLTGYARSLEPERRVYAGVDTLVLGQEMGSVIDILGSLADIGVDAIVVRDLGVCRAARRHFPRLRLHASARMAVQSRAGAEALSKMGFARVVAATELTLEEIREIAAEADIETECLVHGTLCYSYGGLCLFSSHVLGRSANRGRCASPCRGFFSEPGGGDGRDGLPFSMKDLALPDHLDHLRSAGVRSLRIEGSERTPLHVAAVTGYYRRLIDGALDAPGRTALEADLKTISGRPWTELYVGGLDNAEVTEGGTAGHLGAPVGTVESIVFNVGEDVPYVRFATSRHIELHDGLQIDLPGLYKPFGFAVEKLRLVRRTRRARHKEVREAPAGSLVEVALPAEYPQIAPGTVVYCSSSQEVKQRYGCARPKPGKFRSRVPMNVALDVGTEEVVARTEARSPATGRLVAAEARLPGPFAEARQPDRTEAAARGTFSKLGGTRFRPGRLDFENPGSRFVPASVLTGLRRRVASALQEKLAADLTRLTEEAKADLAPKERSPASAAPRFAWSVKIERPGLLGKFEAADLERVEGVAVGVESEPTDALVEELGVLASSVGRERVRLALPVVTRGRDECELRAKIEALRSRGWSKWEASNPSAWAYFDADPASGAAPDGIDLAADWPVYVLNRAAALQVLDMGASRFTLSPEDGFENMRGLLAEFGARVTVIVYQDTPLLVSATRACAAGSTRLVSGHARELVVARRRGLTVVVDARPFSISDRLDELARAGAVHLRADFAWRVHSPDEVLERWRTVRAGRAAPGAHAGNFDRGLE